MYKLLKNILLIISYFLLSSMAIFYININSQAIPEGKTSIISVSEAKTNLHEKIEQIANENHVLIAKQLFLDKKDGMGSTEQAFEKIGQGKLPQIYKEEKDTKILKNAPDDTNYFIIGKGITANELVIELKKMGNSVSLSRVDNRFKPVEMLGNEYLIPVVLLVMSFGTLLLAEQISEIKSNGIRRLSGLSKYKIAFNKILRNNGQVLVICLIFCALGSSYLFLRKNLSLSYVESFVITLMAGLILFILVNFFVSILIFYILQIQRINAAVKGKSPIFLISIVIILFQGFALFASMNSIYGLNVAGENLKAQRIAQTAWNTKKNYYGTSLLGSLYDPQLPTKLKQFTIDLLNQKDIFLVASPFMQEETAWYFGKMNPRNVYVPTSSTGVEGTPNDMNVFYMSSNFIEKANIQLTDEVKNKIKKMGVSDYATLIPDTQKNNFSYLDNTWQALIDQQGLGINSTVNELYHSPKKFFGYTILGNNNMPLNQTYANNPIIIVYSSKTFLKSDATRLSMLFEGYIGNHNLITTNKTKLEEIIKVSQLDNNIGALINGYLGASLKVSDAERQYQILLGVNILCLISSLLLISLLNSIYLYQNRKMFLIQRLAGKKWVDIHMVYLAVVLTLTAVFSGIARVWLHVPNEAFLVPIVYVGLVLILFVAQMNKEKTANVLYLKGL
ncbi:DUF1430 domain-containing protein [Lactococcus sp.]|uniref:DUF1430 domain-containing protein n=1 Tax=Lactococcus sp. TaxID=44273 RepID=UPI0035ADD2AB